MVLGAVVLGYAVTSILLLKFPRLLHRKKTLKFFPTHISHRGGAGENIENTMTAFHHALEVGTEMLEIDCHLTRDGHVIVSHDSSLKRSCECEGQVADFDYKDLPLLKERHKLDFQQSFTYDGTGCPDRRFPLLREVFQAFPSIPINIDIKIDDDELIEKVNQLIVEFNREEITAWGNRSAIVVDKLHRINPNVPLIFSYKKVLLLLVYFYTGLLPFISLEESLLEVVMPGAVLKYRYWLWDNDAVETYLWVLNEDDEFERAFKLGAHGVMTDFPY
ncbi:hypothetical protein FSP39_007822 [Pinctada imbricata]|uniref:GP-PDE domain-containing protein n=1 Tax=Pinctada imbricata TaxID=66713 RepID=A0AA88XF23_PINIB|nr:hypothetical protein FSP39_007822 [Pinctada imbricata]